MENTGNVLFSDDLPQWYIALGDRWIGPLAATDVYQKVLSQDITWAHFVWRPGQPDWMRICDISMFQAAVPHKPMKNVQAEVKEAARPVIKQAGGKKSAEAPARGVGAPPPPGRKSPGAGAPARKQAEERNWFLYYNESQFGPFSTDEITRFLQIGKIHGRVHIWRDGMPNWDRIERISLFKEAAEESKRAREKKKEAASAPAKSRGSRGGASASKPARLMPSGRSGSPAGYDSGAEAAPDKSDLRRAPRRPLVAKILVANDDSVIVGVCRDISVGGMQVLTDRIPGNVGARIKMNVSPSSSDGGLQIDPFVAEGVIVRVLEDGRGFSFRFERLPDGAKRGIESYIDTGG